MAGLPGSSSDNITCWKNFSRGGERATRDVVASMSYASMEVAFLVFLANVFHLVLRRLHLPSAFSQLLAGLVIGSCGLRGRVERTSETVTADDFEDELNHFASLARMLFMFVYGLEVDLRYLWVMRHPSLYITYFSAVTCLIPAAVAADIFLPTMINYNIGAPIASSGILMLAVANTASPVLIRIVQELKLGATEIGRLAISSALINDISCILGVALFSLNPATYAGTLSVVLFTGVALGLIRLMVHGMNWWHVGDRFVTRYELLLLLMFLPMISGMTEAYGYSSMMVSFFLGIVFPRNGPTTRTVLDKLSFLIKAVALPIYVGWTAMRTNVNALFGAGGMVVATSMVLTVMLSIVGKVAGSLAAALYLKMPLRDGLLVGVLLNAKGYLDFITFGMAKEHGYWSEQAFLGMMLGVVLNTLVSIPVAAALAAKELEAAKKKRNGLQWINVDRELRVLTCVHIPRDTPSALRLAELSRAMPGTPIAVFLLHLLELTGSTEKTKLYHLRRKHESYDEKELYDGSHLTVVSRAVDSFTRSNAIDVRQLTAISPLSHMYKDVIAAADEVGASLLVLPHYMEQRYDGKMMLRKEGRRELNRRVLKRAPCTVGILVDRPFTGGIGADALPATASDSGNDEAAAVAKYVHRVGAVFFGGPDDREAVAYACRLSVHPYVAVTVVRFTSGAAAGSDRITVASSGCGIEVSMSVRQSHADQLLDSDEDFISAIHKAFVEHGYVTYMEKTVTAWSETTAELQSMAREFTLLIVGKGGRQPEAMLPVLSEAGGGGDVDEVGPVGELLASDQFAASGSVLIMQQPSFRDLMAQETCGRL